MNKMLKTLIAAAAIFACALPIKAATVRYTEIRPTGTLQPNTTGPAAVHVGSGTIKQFRADAATVTAANLGTAVVTTLTPTNITGTNTDTSTSTHSGAHTFSSMTVTAATIGTANLSTINGTITDASTGTHSGTHSFSSATVTNLTVGASTVTRSNIAGLSATLNANLNAANFLINNVSTPTAGTDAPRFHNVGIVQLRTYSVTAASNTTGASYSNTALAGAFIPQFDDSTIKVFTFTPVWFAGGAAGSQQRVVRGASTDITGTNCQTSYNNPTTYGFGPFCYGSETSPGAGSSVTYTLQQRSATAGQNIGTCDGTNACLQLMVIMEVNTK